MSTPKTDHHKCSSTELKILGDFWTLEIIQSLASGEKRFSQLERDLPKINPTTLSNRLKKLTQQKIAKRRGESGNDLAIIYELTPKGQGIIPILKQIKIFADKHLSS